MPLVTPGDPLGNAVRAELARKQALALAALRPDPEPTGDAELDPIRAAVKAKQAAALRRFLGNPSPSPTLTPICAPHLVESRTSAHD